MTDESHGRHEQDPQDEHRGRHELPPDAPAVGPAQAPGKARRPRVFGVLAVLLCIAVLSL